MSTTDTRVTAQERFRAALEAVNSGGRDYAHRLKRGDIMRSLIEGVEVPTVCGLMMEVSTDKGDVWDGGGRLEVCPACDLVRDLPGD